MIIFGSLLGGCFLLNTFLAETVAKRKKRETQMVKDDCITNLVIQTSQMSSVFDVVLTQ